MKHPFILLFLTVIGTNSLLAQKTSQDQEAVRKIIEMETKYYFEGNYDKWAETLAHDPSCYVVNAGPEYHNELIGWNNISTVYKKNMQNTPPLSEAELAQYKKYDYVYKINGNMADVTFKEGKGNFGTRVLEKQSGEWKITGMTNVLTTAYKFQSDYTALKSFTGKWKFNPRSFKEEPADTNSKLLSFTSDIHEGTYGIEFVSNESSSYNGKFYSFCETEQFTKDNEN
jgi:hypothetical protein